MVPRNLISCVVAKSQKGEPRSHSRGSKWAKPGRSSSLVGSVKKGQKILFSAIRRCRRTGNTACALAHTRARRAVQPDSITSFSASAVSIPSKRKCCRRHHIRNALHPHHTCTHARTSARHRQAGRPRIRNIITPLCPPSHFQILEVSTLHTPTINLNLNLTSLSFPLLLSLLINSCRLPRRRTSRRSPWSRARVVTAGSRERSIQ